MSGKARSGRAGKAGGDREACIACMTVLGIPYRLSSEEADFAMVRRAVAAYASRLPPENGPRKGDPA